MELDSDGEKEEEGKTTMGPLIYTFICMEARRLGETLIVSAVSLQQCFSSRRLKECTVHIAGRDQTS